MNSIKTDIASIIQQIERGDSTEESILSRVEVIIKDANSSIQLEIRRIALSGCRSISSDQLKSLADIIRSINSLKNFYDKMTKSCSGKGAMS